MGKIGGQKERQDFTPAVSALPARADIPRCMTYNTSANNLHLWNLDNTPIRACILSICCNACE
jgi:hypothetical protein